MFKHKKTAAFILSILICSSSIMSSAAYIFAENESSVSEASEEETDVSEQEQEQKDDDDDAITSGDFTYTAPSSTYADLHDGNAICIVSYTGDNMDVSFPETLDGKYVVTIDSNVFEGNSDILSIHLPASVVNVPDIFSRCEKLKEITVAEDNPLYYTVDGILYSSRENTEPTIHCYPQAKEGTSFTIPDGVTTIGTAAIYNTKLSELNLPATIDYIYNHGISYNENLTSIDFSQCTELYEIGDMVMASCPVLSEVILPPALTYIGAAAFANCMSLEKIELPETLTTIGQNAFAATGMTQVTIPASVTDIGYCAFGYDENLEIMSNFTIIGTYGSAAQSYCTDSDEDYDYANNFTFIRVEDSGAFEEAAQLEQLAYGDYTYAESEGEAIIMACTSVESVIEVPAEINGLPVTRIYNAAFFGNLATEIILPDTVKEINDFAFYMCSNLKRITLSASLETISSQAFCDCAMLESLEIPGSCTSIGDDAFLGCYSIKEFTVGSGEGGSYSAENGVLYNKDKTILLAYPASKTDESFKTGNDVKTIGASAFYANTSIKTIDLSSVTVIEDYAFEDCTSLSKVKLSKDLEKIGTCSFYNCKSLLKLRTYDKITEIGEAAIGYQYHESENTEDIIEGFKLYSPKESVSEAYALINNIDCSTNTIELFGANVELGFVYAICGIIAAAILAVIGIFIGKNVKKKKSEKEAERLKAEVQTKLSQKKNPEPDENVEGKDSENESKTK